MHAPVPCSPYALRCLAAVGLVALGCREAQPRFDFSDGEESVYGFLSEGTRSRADLLLQDRWDLGARFASVTVIPELTWTEDPFGDQYWRFLFYSLRPTTHLLAAYGSTGQVKYRDKLLEILRSYAAHDEARAGQPEERLALDYPHAAAFRALVLVNTVRKLERTGDIDAALDASLRASIARLGAFLARDENFETYNHGFTEAVALAVVARNFPELAGASEWMELGLARLDGLMTEAVDADGVEKENSPFYHFYVLGFALQIQRWARAHDVPLSSSFDAAVAGMIPFATYALQPDGMIPELGASVELGVENLDMGVYGEVARANPKFQFVLTLGASGTPPQARAVLFPVSGLAALRSGFGTSSADAGAETHVMLNVGPWRTKHSHLDVLGLTYYSAGRRLLCDSGLFTYLDGVDKSFFHGTRAHNTVVVDGGDQAKAGAIQAGLSAEGDRWSYQSGWHELYPGVVHRRSVLVLERDLMLVVDALDGDGAHDFAQTWHLPVDFTVEASGLDLDARPSGGAVELALRQAWPEGVSLSTATGATAPLQGWISNRYGQKEAATALEYHVAGRGARFLTLVASGAKARSRPSVAGGFDAGGTVRAHVCGGDGPLDVTITQQAAAGEAVSVTASAVACP